MKNKWIEAFQIMFATADMDVGKATDEEILELGKSFLSGQFCKDLNIQHRWQFDLFFEAYINTVEPPENLQCDVNMDRFIDRSKEFDN